ncbi:unknown [Bacteroides sp. CAG:144]|nr:unknown [Bacteroides sp. CAG:144]
MPKIPPSNELKKTCKKPADKPGIIYNAGNVNITPATTVPEQAPMDCIITFSPNAFFRLNPVESPTAIMAIGMAASNT